MKKYFLASVIAFIGILITASAQISSTEPKSSIEGEESGLEVYIPNAFTPNMDHLNDVFKPVIYGPEIEIYELNVIDRSGSVVFSTTSPDQVWDGTVEGSSYTSSPAVFVYTLKIKSVESIEVERFTGHIVMIR